MSTRCPLLLPILITALATVVSSAGDAATPGAGHATIACTTCHHTGSAVAATARPALARHCRACHGEVATAAAHGDAAVARCLDCHRFHEPRHLTPALSAVDPAGGDRSQAHCRSCHAAPGRLQALSAAHRTAAVLYHREARSLAAVSPSEACLRCHAQTSQSSWKSAIAGRQLTFNTHASHPYGIKVTPGEGDSTNWIAVEIDVRVPLFAGKMECQSCHLLTVDQDDLLIPFETKYDLCRGCHAHDGGRDRASAAVVTAVAVR